MVLKRLGWKMERFARLVSLVGVRRAIGFESAWTVRRPEVGIRLPGFANDLILRRRTSDVQVFWSTFLTGELQEWLPEQPRLIVDGGANVGYTTAFYAQRFPESMVIAVEPFAENCAMWRRNCSGFRHATLLEGALWPDRGTLRIANPEAASYAIQVRPGEGEQEVRAHTTPDSLEQAGLDQIDLLKLDIEGAETALLTRNTEGWLDRVRSIVVEVHGQEAQAAIDAAYPEDRFARKVSGDKLILRQKA
jgi:FkbM family methyltransferase